MIRKTSTFLALAGIITATCAQASPLQNIFTSISNIGKPQQTASTQTSTDPQTTVPTSSAEDILRTLADSSISLSLTSMCSPEFFKQNEQAALAKIKGGDFAGGGTDAKINAQEIAVCSVKRQKLPMDLAEQIAGQNLAESAIALHRAGMDTPETITSAQNALTLLSVNASANTALIKQLKASGILPEKPAEAADTAAVTMSAVTVTKKYMANSFAFNQQYNGKTLQIRGKIHSVGGNSNSVFIILAGVPQEDPGMNDQVDCNITRPAYMSAASSVSKGQTITIQGVFTVPTQAWLQGSVTLQDCRIVQ